MLSNVITKDVQALIGNVLEWELTVPVLSAAKRVRSVVASDLMYQGFVPVVAPITKEDVVSTYKVQATERLSPASGLVVATL